MKIKKGDKVQVMAGKDKGIIGNVLAVYPEKNKVVVEGAHIVKKHVKPNQANPDGGIESKEAPIDASNVMIYDSKAKKAGRIGYTMEKDEKVRINRKTGAKIKIDKKK
jgi:large subunit ribosomal protein L24